MEFNSGFKGLNVSAFFMPKVNIIGTKQFELLKTQHCVGNKTETAGYNITNGGYIDLLKTKRKPLYLKTQFVPRSKHFSSRL